MAAESDDARLPVLEIGGTHVTAAVVSVAGLSVQRQKRVRLNAQAQADELISAFLSAAKSIQFPAPYWSVAIPGPFDYDSGVAHFAEVGKFDSLNGVNVRSRLELGLSTRVHLLNDADAFGIGEASAGAGAGFNRTVFLTLGTGVGSAFLTGLDPVHDGPTVPPLGSVHLLRPAGRPLEDLVSRRAIRRAYFDTTGIDADVHEIADRARMNDARAVTVLEEAMLALGMTVAPWVATFQAEAVVVGGSISQSWDLISTPLSGGLDQGLAHRGGNSALPEVRQATLGDSGPLIGAALYGRRVAAADRREA